MSRVMGRWVVTHRPPLILVQGRAAGDTLRRYGFLPRWSSAGRGWILQDDHLPDVCAIAGLTTLGYRVIDSAEDCAHSDQRAELRELDTDPSERGVPR